MKILLSAIPFDNGKSGISVYIREVVKALEQAGHELTLIVEDDGAKEFERFELIVVEDNVATPYGTKNEEIPVEELAYEENDSPANLEEMRSSAKAFEQTALCTLLDIFGEEIMIPEEDY